MSSKKVPIKKDIVRKILTPDTKKPRTNYKKMYFQSQAELERVRQEEKSAWQRMKDMEILAQELEAQVETMTGKINYHIDRDIIHHKSMSDSKKEYRRIYERYQSDRDFILSLMTLPWWKRFFGWQQRLEDQWNKSFTKLMEG
jgi:hypothetical protein